MSDDLRLLFLDEYLCHFCIYQSGLAYLIPLPPSDEKLVYLHFKGRLGGDSEEVAHFRLLLLVLYTEIVACKPFSSNLGRQDLDSIIESLNISLEKFSPLDSYLKDALNKLGVLFQSAFKKK